MARVSVPSFSEIQQEVGPGEWLDELIKVPEPVKDPNFEVSDFTLSATSSSNPTRPRTLRAGYDSNTGKLIVVFRDGTWWEYRGVPKEIWERFKAAESKGRFLRESGLDTWDDMGPADMGKIPTHRRVQINENVKVHHKMHGK